MQLNIKNDEAHRFAKELAERTGESLTQAVTKALRDRLEREQDRKTDPAAREHRLQRLKDIVARFDTLPVLDDREPDQILGYDEDGLPT